MKRFLSFLTLVGVVLSGFAADYETTVNNLIPRLADPDVPKRYDAQIELQDIASESSKPGNEPQREALGKALAARITQASVPQPARVWMVRQLEYMGRGEAVPALTDLLSGEDAELRECARRALEKNPASAATDSLRAALKKATADLTTEGIRWRIGLINSLAEKRDIASVKLIIPQLAEKQTASAAALALGKIANGDAIAALWTAVGSNPQAAEALINIGNHRLAEGDKLATKMIFQKLWDPLNLPSVQAAALAGRLKASPEQAEAILAEGLSRNIPSIQQAALEAGRGVLGSQYSAVLGRLLPNLSTDVKIQALALIGTPGEAAVIKETSDSDPAVQAAALEALGRMGAAASVPALLAATGSGEGAISSNAKQALARVAGPGSAEAIRQAAANGNPSSRAAAIEALAARQDQQSVSALLAFAAQAEPTVAKAAWEALGKLGGDTEVQAAGRLALKTQSTEAVAALEEIVTRVSDQPAAAEKLLAIAGSDDSTRVLFVNALGTLGGDPALAFVAKLAGSAQPNVKSKAIRALSNWPDYSAAKPLLAVAANPETENTLNILALQGIARLIKAADQVAANDRADTALAAWEAARRPEEKKLMLSAMGTVPQAKIVAVVQPLLQDEAFKAEAALAGVELAERLAKSDKTSAQALANAVKAVDVSKEITQRANKVLKQ